MRKIVLIGSLLMVTMLYSGYADRHYMEYDPDNRREWIVILLQDPSFAELENFTIRPLDIQAIGPENPFFPHVSHETVTAPTLTQQSLIEGYDRFLFFYAQGEQLSSGPINGNPTILSGNIRYARPELADACPGYYSPCGDLTKSSGIRDYGVPESDEIQKLKDRIFVLETRVANLEALVDELRNN